FAVGGQPGGQPLNADYFLGGQKAVVIAVVFGELAHGLAGLHPLHERDLPVVVGVQLREPGRYFLGQLAGTPDHRDGVIDLVDLDAGDALFFGVLLFGVFLLGLAARLPFLLAGFPIILPLLQADLAVLIFVPLLPVVLEPAPG